MDFMQLLPVLPGTHTHLAQFSINLGCGSYQPANRWDTFHPRGRSEVRSVCWDDIGLYLFISGSVSLEFSTNQGRSWSLLHTECLPELCAGPHLPHSTIYSSDNYSG